YEDGRQTRDFVHVTDLARGCALAVTSDRADGRVLNLGSGDKIEVAHIARILAEALERPMIEPELLDTFRSGDVRHCFADIGLARELLGYEPRTTIAQGLAELAEYVATQEAVDQVQHAAEELVKRHLAR